MCRLHLSLLPTALLWERLRDSKLGVKFRRQQVITGFIADFYCHSAALVVEVDGSQHSPEVDAGRDAILRAHPLRLLRFSNRAAREEMYAVLAEIRVALA